MKPLRISAIGSCRLYGPLRAASLDNPDVEFRPLFGHTHNPQEILQAFRLISGEVTFSQAFATLMNVKNVSGIAQEAEFSAEMSRSDVIAIELSSLRAIEYSGMSFQKNVFSNALAELNVDSATIKDLHRGGARADAARQQILDRIEPGPLKEIVRSGRFYEISREETFQYIDRVRSLTCKPILLIGVVHVFPETKSTAVRGRLQDMLADYAGNTDDVSFFNPSSIMTEENYDGFMKDSAHYREDAMERVGRSMLDAAIALLK